MLVDGHSKVMFFFRFSFPFSFENINFIIFFSSEVDDPVHQVRRARNEFFRPVIVQEIFFKLVNEYLVLNEKDLTAWDTDPEAYGKVICIFVLNEKLRKLRNLCVELSFLEKLLSPTVFGTRVV